jgi:uncharacterized cupin superfamily protein
MHVQDVDQIFYIFRGTMSIEIEGRQYDCGPGSLIIFPAGVRHRTWNGGTEPTVHLAFNTPMPDLSKPFARSASKMWNLAQAELMRFRSRRPITLHSLPGQRYNFPALDLQPPV